MVTKYRHLGSGVQRMIASVSTTRLWSLAATAGLRLWRTLGTHRLGFCATRIWRIHVPGMRSLPCDSCRDKASQPCHHYKCSPVAGSVPRCCELYLAKGNVQLPVDQASSDHTMPCIRVQCQLPHPASDEFASAGVKMGRNPSPPGILASSRYNQAHAGTLHKHRLRT
jgi:hypothetical protein